MYCKLTNQNLQTHRGFQWVIGEWKETSGKGILCTEGWLHCYTHSLLAVFLNKIHADIQNPRLFEIEVAGETKTDHGLKVGFTKMRLIKEISLPQVTNMQRIAFGILCAKELETHKKWNIWADNWLNGTDRTQESASNVACSAAQKHYKQHYHYAAYVSAYGAAICGIDAYIYYHTAVVAQYIARSKPINLIELAEKALTYN